jgi:hypothetical protein
MTSLLAKSQNKSVPRYARLSAKSKSFPLANDVRLERLWFWCLTLHFQQHECHAFLGPLNATAPTASPLQQRPEDSTREMIKWN